MARTVLAFFIMKSCFRCRDILPKFGGADGEVVFVGNGLPNLASN